MHEFQQLQLAVPLQAVASFGLVTPSTISAATQGSAIVDPSHLVEATEAFASMSSGLGRRPRGVFRREFSCGWEMGS